MSQIKKLLMLNVVMKSLCLSVILKKEHHLTNDHLGLLLMLMTSSY